MLAVQILMVHPNYIGVGVVYGSSAKVMTTNQSVSLTEMRWNKEYSLMMVGR